MSRRPPDPLAHPRLPLQREGALGPGPQGHRARAAGASARRPHRVRALAHPRLRDHLPGPDHRRPPHRRLDRDHRRARGAPARAPALPGRPRRAPARPRPRGLLRRGARGHIRGCSPGTSCSSDGDRFRDDRRTDGARPGETGGRAGDRLRRRLTPSSASASPMKTGRSWRGSRSSPPSTASRPSSRRSGGGYLVGDRFTVADLTAASLFYPVVLPERGADGSRRHGRRRNGSIPRAAEGAPRLHLGRRDVPPPPQAGAGRYGVRTIFNASRLS